MALLHCRVGWCWFERQRDMRRLLRWLESWWQSQRGSEACSVPCSPAQTGIYWWFKDLSHLLMIRSYKRLNKPLPHGWSSSRPQFFRTLNQTPPCPETDSCLFHLFSKFYIHHYQFVISFHIVLHYSNFDLIIMAVTTGELDVSKQKMVLFITGVRAKD